MTYRFIQDGTGLFEDVEHDFQNSVILSAITMTVSGHNAAFRTYCNTLHLIQQVGDGFLEYF